MDFLLLLFHNGLFTFISLTSRGDAAPFFSSELTLADDTARLFNQIENEL